ncbi:DUF1120 domain-containing protein [Ralstonia sp. UBA689]|uniref:DUF1120 domain-containing protein n=1 Tax=Ralstonia sp. UBA689 TaxID=1947373 RepID=UPI0025F32B19|nr:DUF1120 domain-containing protein [Ralstonia sp. UBA689]
MNQYMIAKAAAVVVLGAALAAPVAAANSSGTLNATLNVTGTLSPGACNVSFVGGSDIDYSNITSNSLSATNYTALAEHSKDLQVACGANTNAYVSVQDNRSTSAIRAAAMKTALGNASLADTQVFGLGTSGTASVGAYTISMGPASVVTAFGGTATTQPAVLSSADKTTWTASTTPVALTSGGAQYYSAGPSGTNPTPVAARTWTFPLSVVAALNNTTDLPVKEDVPLDGSATFTVSYQ